MSARAPPCSSTAPVPWILGAQERGADGQGDKAVDRKAQRVAEEKAQLSTLDAERQREEAEKQRIEAERQREQVSVLNNQKKEVTTHFDFLFADLYVSLHDSLCSLQ